MTKKEKKLLQEILVEREQELIAINKLLETKNTQELLETKMLVEDSIEYLKEEIESE